jgi:4'-phosphopantetheinyl transferase
MQLDSPIEWRLPPPAASWAENEIQLWCVDLQAQSFALEKLHAILSADERSRARRFRFGKDQIQFIVARSYLRLILGRYVQCPPARLRFGYSAQGKPWLHPENGAKHILRFNLAHSGELILYAVSWQQEVGIDVEYMRAETSYKTIAEQFFSPTEIATLRTLPSEQQSQAFFHCWTRKEAYLKARGEGLSFPLDGFEVSLDSSRPVSLKVYQFPYESEHWRLYSLFPKTQYVGAVAVEGQQHTLQFYSTRELS